MSSTPNRNTPITRPQPPPSPSALYSLVGASPSLTPMLHPWVTTPQGGTAPSSAPIAGGPPAAHLHSLLPATTRSLSPADAIALRELQAEAIMNHLLSRLPKELDPVLKATDTLITRSKAAAAATSSTTAAVPPPNAAAVAVSLGKVIQRVEALQASYGPLLSELAALFPPPPASSSDNNRNDSGSLDTCMGSGGYGPAMMLLSDALLADAPELFFHSSDYHHGGGGDDIAGSMQHPMSSFLPALTPAGANTIPRRDDECIDASSSSGSRRFYPPTGTMRSGNRLRDVLEQLSSSSSTRPPYNTAATPGGGVKLSIPSTTTDAPFTNQQRLDASIPTSILSATSKHHQEQTALKIVQRHFDSEKRPDNSLSWRREKNKKKTATPPLDKNNSDDFTENSTTSTEFANSKGGQPKSSTDTSEAVKGIPIHVYERLIGSTKGKDATSFTRWMCQPNPYTQRAPTTNVVAERKEGDDEEMDGDGGLKHMDNNSDGDAAVVASFDALRESYATKRLITRDVVEYLVAMGRLVTARRVARAADGMESEANSSSRDGGEQQNYEPSSSLEEQFPALHPAFRSTTKSSVDILPLLVQTPCPTATATKTNSRDGSVVGGGLNSGVSTPSLQAVGGGGSATRSGAGKPPMPPYSSQQATPSRQPPLGNNNGSNLSSVTSTPLRQPLLPVTATPSMTATSAPPPSPPSMLPPPNIKNNNGGGSKKFVLYSQLSSVLNVLRHSTAELHDFVIDVQSSEAPSIVSAKQQQIDIRLQEEVFTSKITEYASALVDSCILAFVLREESLKYCFATSSSDQSSASRRLKLTPEEEVDDSDHHSGYTRPLATASTSSVFWRRIQTTSSTAECGGGISSGSTTGASTPRPLPIGDFSSPVGTISSDEYGNGPLSASSPHHRTVAAILNASLRVFLRKLIATLAHRFPTTSTPISVDLDLADNDHDDVSTNPPAAEECLDDAHSTRVSPSSALHDICKYLCSHSAHILPSLLPNINHHSNSTITRSQQPHISSVSSNPLQLHPNTQAFWTSLNAPPHRGDGEQPQEVEEEELTSEGRLQLLVLSIKTVTAIIIDQCVKEEGSRGLVDRYHSFMDGMLGVRELLFGYLHDGVGDHQHDDRPSSTYENTTTAVTTTSSQSVSSTPLTDAAAGRNLTILSEFSSGGGVGSPLDLLRSLFGSPTTAVGRQRPSSVNNQSSSSPLRSPPLPPKISVFPKHVNSGPVGIISAPTYTLLWYLQVLASTTLTNCGDNNKGDNLSPGYGGGKESREGKYMVGRPTSNWFPPQRGDDTNASAASSPLSSRRLAESIAVHAALDDKVYLLEVAHKAEPQRTPHHTPTAASSQPEPPPPQPPRLVQRATLAALSLVDTLSTYVATPAAAVESKEEDPLHRLGQRAEEEEEDEHDDIVGREAGKSSGLATDYKGPPNYSWELDMQQLLSTRKMGSEMPDSVPRNKVSTSATTVATEERQRAMWGAFVVMLVEGGLVRRTSDPDLEHPTVLLQQRPHCGHFAPGNNNTGDRAWMSDDEEDVEDAEEEEQENDAREESRIWRVIQRSRNIFVPSNFLDRLSQFEASVVSVRRPNSVRCPFTGVDLLGDSKNSRCTTTFASRAALLRNKLRGQYSSPTTSSPGNEPLIRYDGASLLDFATETDINGTHNYNSSSKRCNEGVGLVLQGMLSADGATTAVSLWQSSTTSTAYPLSQRLSIMSSIGPLANPFHMTPFSTVDRFPICQYLKSTAPSTGTTTTPLLLQQQTQFPTSLYELVRSIRKCGSRRWEMGEEDHEKASHTAAASSSSQPLKPRFVIPTADILFIEQSPGSSYHPVNNSNNNTTADNNYDSGNHSTSPQPLSSNTYYSDGIRAVIPPGKPITLPNGVTITDSLLPLLAVYIQDESAVDLLSPEVLISTTAHSGVSGIRSVPRPGTAVLNAGAGGGIVGVGAAVRPPPWGERPLAGNIHITTAPEGTGGQRVSSNIPFSQLVRRHLFWRALENSTDATNSPVGFAEFIQSGVGLQAAVAAVAMSHEGRLIGVPVLAEEEEGYQQHISSSIAAARGYRDNNGDGEDGSLQFEMDDGDDSPSPSLEGMEEEGELDDPNVLLELLDNAIAHQATSTAAVIEGRSAFDESAVGEDHSEEGGGGVQAVLQQAPSPPVLQVQAEVASELLLRISNNPTTNMEVLVASGDGGAEADEGGGGGSSDSNELSSSSTSSSSSSELEVPSSRIDVEETSISPTSQSENTLQQPHPLSLETVIFLLSDPMRPMGVVSLFRAAAIHGEVEVVGQELNRIMSGERRSLGRSTSIPSWRRTPSTTTPTSRRGGAASTRLHGDVRLDVAESTDTSEGEEIEMATHHTDNASSTQTPHTAPLLGLDIPVPQLLRAVTQGRNLVLAMAVSQPPTPAHRVSREYPHGNPTTASPPTPPPLHTAPAAPVVVRTVYPRSVSRLEQRNLLGSGLGGGGGGMISPQRRVGGGVAHRPRIFDEDNDFTHPRLGQAATLPTPTSYLPRRGASPHTTTTATAHQHPVSSATHHDLHIGGGATSYSLRVMCPRTGELFELAEIKQTFFL